MARRQRNPRPITITAHAARRDKSSAGAQGGRIRVAWMTRGRQSWRIEFEEGREFAAALAVMDHVDAGGPFALDYFEATMLAAQILDTAQSKFRSISEHIAAALESSPAPVRQAA